MIYRADILWSSKKWEKNETKKNMKTFSTYRNIIYLCLLCPNQQTNGQNINIIDVHWSGESSQKKSAAEKIMYPLFHNLGSDILKYRVALLLK